MKETLGQTVIDTLDYLMTIGREGTRPEQAKSGLRSLQRQHSDFGMRLIWEEESYDRSVHYDALLNVPGNGTISISYCDDRTKPWPLRGVSRWSDGDLVRVNNNVLTVDQAIACLDFIWDEAGITDRLVKVCLIDEELEKNPIDLSDQELQLAMDAFRRARKLYTTGDTHLWMERRGVTYPQFEQLVASQATIGHLRDKLVANRVQDYFDAHPADFDTAYIARFLVPDEASALGLCDRIRSGDIDFFQAAEDRFIAAKQSRQTTADLLTVVQRREAPEEIRTSLFESAPGCLLGPVRDGDGYAIIRVLSIVRGNLDVATRETIKRILFEHWIEERRQAADIEWFWGTASKTSKTE